MKYVTHYHVNSNKKIELAQTILKVTIKPSLIKSSEKYKIVCCHKCGDSSSNL